MRILHVLDHSLPLHSGYAFRTHAILAGQREMGWQTFQLTSAKQGQVDADAEEVDGFTYYRCAAAGGLAARLPVLDQLAVIRLLEQRLRTLIPQLQPDIIHAHSPALTGVACANAARRFELPLLYECRAFWEDAAVDHGTTRAGSVRYRLTRALETWVCRRADALTTICEGIRGDLLARGLAGDKVTVIPNAVDLEQFTRGGERSQTLATRLGLDGRRVLGFIGSFYGYEGLDLLLDALPAIAARVPDAALLLVGGGPQEDALQRRAARLATEAPVVFTGRVPHSEVNDYYDLIDILVYPRRSIRLTELVTPLKPLEAMARGRLLVASDVGGHRELIRDGETGTLFQAGDAKALAEAAIALLERQDTWPRRLDTARRFVERERTWPASVARYRGVYEGLLARGAVQ